jgi:hypothetical protein
MNAAVIGLGPQGLRIIKALQAIPGMEIKAVVDSRPPQILGGWIGEAFGWQMALQGMSTRGVLVSFRFTWNAPCGCRHRLSIEC